MKTAVIVIAYNRHKSLRRLLKSLLYADYTTFLNVPLVISIDKNENKEVYKEAEKYHWPFGTKEIRSHKEHLGLRKHILNCGDLTKKYGSIIMLEDDLLVSPLYYQYATCALNSFKDDEKIAGISLYSYKFNEAAKRPFEPIHDGFDNYFIQTASSWGQAWSSGQWLKFREWYNSDECKVTKNDKIPANVIAWPETSWKKYFIKYMVDKDKYFVYPRISLTTNFGDPGTHMEMAKTEYQVPLLIKKKNYNFLNIDDSLAVYDSFYEILTSKIVLLNEYLSTYNPEIDLYGTKDVKKVTRNYILTSKRCKNIVQSYSRAMKPNETSIVFGIDGNDFYLAKTSEVLNKNGKSFIETYKEYMDAYSFLTFSVLLTILLSKFIFKLKKIFKLKNRWCD